MARIRSIKPDFWTDEKVVELTFPARLLFIGLWNFADDDGRMVYSPKKIKMQIFPSDNLNISELFGEIRRELMINIYLIDEIEYLQIINFKNHQKIDKRTPSKIPECSQTIQLPPNPPELLQLTPTDMEGNGMEGSYKNKTLMSSSTNIDPAKLARLKLNREYVEQAKDVLRYLNKNAGKNFREVDSTLSQIIARLKEGYTAERLREIAYYKIEQWGTDEKMAEYLRPATLYNKTNCAQYDGEL